MRYDSKMCAWPGCLERGDVTVGDEFAELVLCDWHADLENRQRFPAAWEALRTLKHHENHVRASERTPRPTGRPCPVCGANAEEIRATGHRRHADGRGGDRACPEACTCLPEHRSRAEHLAECGAYADRPLVR